jgi:hypothetical protein
MSSSLIYFHGDFQITQVVGHTGTFPNRIFSIKGQLLSNDYKYGDVVLGDILYDYDWKKYEVKGFENSIMPVHNRTLLCTERPEGNIGLTGSISTGLGLMVRPQTFGDLIIGNKKREHQTYFCPDSYLAATNNCNIGENTTLAAIISCHNSTNDVDESLMVNEICSMGTSLISDQNLVKNISICPTGTVGELFPKVLALKTHQYCFKSEDDNAPMRRGFLAQEVQTQFPEMVKTNFRRKHQTRKNDNGIWVDNLNNAVDTEIYTIVVDNEHPNMGFYYTTENRSHMCVDSTAMLEKIWIIMQKLIEENETLKTRVTTLEGHH